MADTYRDQAFDMAQAALGLSFHCTSQLMQLGTLSVPKRLECAEILRTLSDNIESWGPDRNQLIAMTDGVRDLIAQLDDQG